MGSELKNLELVKDDACKESLWEELYRKLRPRIRNFVYSHKFSLIKGQEADIIEDLLQDAVMRVFKYAKRAKDGCATAIDSIERFGYITALNVCRDWWRKERHRLGSISLDDGMSEDLLSEAEVLNPEEVALNQVYQEWLFMKAARDIAQFPDKTRRALLIELAERAFFDDQLTPLQKAFLCQGIRLSDFQELKPVDQKLRAQHNSLASHAFKRVKILSHCYIH